MAKRPVRQLIFSDAERILFSDHPHRISQSSELRNISECLSQPDIDIIIEYLKGPTSVGIWGVKTKIDVNGFIKHIKEKYLKIDKESTKKRNEEGELNATLSRITFLFSLFYYIQQKESGAEDKKIEANFIDDDLKIFQKINNDEIKSDFLNAYKIFIDKIYIENFDPIIGDQIFFFRNHHCYIDRDDLTLTLTSTSYESLEILVNFLDELHYIKPVKISKLFSPAETVFSMYIFYLEHCFSMLVSSEELQEKISIALSEFNQGRNPHCVNTLGIFTESLLIEIFETLFRQELDKKMPMGELFNQIQDKIHAIVNPKQEEIPIDIEGLFKEIDEISPLIGKESNDQINRRILRIIRKTIHYGRTEEKNLKETMKRHLQKDGRVTIFPNSKLSNFNELREYRNAISHRSRIQINEFEAIRSFYCCISLYTWWQDTISNVDWSLPKDEIIKKLVECKVDQ